MSFSDASFAYGPFAPHHVPRQYVENYFSIHKTDGFLQLSTTVEEIKKLPPSNGQSAERWKLTLRKHDALRKVDVWWEEEFDAVILANGHYAVPYVSLPSTTENQSSAPLTTPGPPSQRPRRIHSKIPRPHLPLKRVPRTHNLRRQKGPHHRQLRLRPRPLPRPRRHRASPSLPISPLQSALGRRRPLIRHRVEARHPRVSPQRAHRLLRRLPPRRRRRSHLLHGLQSELSVLECARQRPPAVGLRR